jgi:hypothetical protein
MYIWKPNNLAIDLRNNNVSEKEKLKYTLFWVLAMVIFSDPAIYIGYEYVLNDTIISAAGTIYCYKINKRGDNKDFISRYICLSIPVGIRALAVLAFVIIAIVIIDLSFEMNVLGGEEEVFTTTIPEIIIFSIFMVYLYFYLGKFIEIASKKNAYKALHADPKSYASFVALR